MDENKEINPEEVPEDFDLEKTNKDDNSEGSQPLEAIVSDQSDTTTGDDLEEDTQKIIVKKEQINKDNQWRAEDISDNEVISPSQSATQIVDEDMQEEISNPELPTYPELNEEVTTGDDIPTQPPPDNFLINGGDPD
ncbi:MAG: hypothetical protein MUO40_08180, partial [Anaerolineaceae bacterium]|nr:hypothetical protein [Anaerolineaceae bacterium]